MTTTYSRNKALYLIVLYFILSYFNGIVVTCLRGGGHSLNFVSTVAGNHQTIDYLKLLNVFLKIDFE